VSEPADPELPRAVFRADRGDAAHRLDHVLVRRLGLSRTRLQALIAAGRVRVNGVPVTRPADRMALGDEVDVLLPPPPPERPGPLAQEIPLTVLHEDDWLLALAKPPGMVVHPTFGHARGTLLNALLWHLRETDGGETRPGLVNRLDKWTSGVLLAAKSGAIHGRLARELRARTALKDYLAVVYGVPRLARGRIESGLLRDPADPRRMITSRTEGRASVTLYEALATSEGDGVRLTLVRCRLLTGRMHQIRVHLHAEGLPLVGDPVYGEPRWKGIRDPTLAAACRAFPRQALHAHRIALTHPVTREPLDVTAPLPEDLQGLLAAAGLGGGLAGAQPMSFLGNG
jgi:23S rRNA pseudouridine1911/1915/1917 synthase